MAHKHQEQEDDLGEEKEAPKKRPRNSKECLATFLGALGVFI